jgi:hypothetical protein
MWATRSAPAQAQTLKPELEALRSHLQGAQTRPETTAVRD